jgi:hypothetical protein
VAKARDVLGYIRTVSRGSPVDRPRSMAGMILGRLVRRPTTPEDSPLTLEDVMARADYRDLRTPKVAVGDPAPDFELPAVRGGGTVHLASLAAERPVALVFGSYT